MLTKTMPAFDATDLEYIETLPASTVEPSADEQVQYWLAQQEEAENELAYWLNKRNSERELLTKQALADELQRLLKQDRECIRFGVDYVLYSLNKSGANTVCQIESQLEILREDILTIDLAIPNEPLTEAVLHTIDSLLSVIDSTKEGWYV